MPTIKSPNNTAISVSEAFSIVLRSARTAPSERRPLRECLGSVLREAVSADRDFPPFDRVSMDGIAIAYAAYERGVRQFRIEGVQAAGAPVQVLSDPSSCIEVMTGAVLPQGCDCVIPVEELTREGTTAILGPDASASGYRYVHRRGSDRRRGDALLPEGTRLRSPETAVCATVGKDSLEVSRRLSAAIVSTGDELVEPAATPEPYQIRISNSYAVESALLHSGCARTELFHVQDDRDALEKLFEGLLTSHDLLVISGGVSAGRFDLVPPALEKLGVKTLFHHVAQRPGYPLLFGSAASGSVVFALPGNPVSSLVSTHRYVIPYLEACCGATAREPESCVLEEGYRFEMARTLFLPVKVRSDGEGRLFARPVEVSGSGDLAGLLESDGFVELPAEQSLFEAGTSWPLTRWE